MGTVPIVPALSCYKIGQVAESLIKIAYPTLLQKPQPFPIDKFFEKDLPALLSYEYAVQELPHGIEGATDPIEKEVVLSPDSYDLLLEGNGRARFTACHEIGHVILHARFLRERLLDGRGTVKLHRSNIPAYKDPEYQADAFASALLMPTTHVQNLLKRGVTSKNLASIFQVSRQAAEVRIAKLNLFLK